MPAIVVDIYEPESIKQLLGQMMQVQIQNLENLDLCDYFWAAADSHTVTLERKTWTDLMAHIGSLEVRLRKATRVANEVGLLVEGVADPCEGGEIATYDFSTSRKGKSYFYQNRISKMKYDFIMAFLWRLDKTGISVYYTNSLRGTAWALRAFVENEQNIKHTTLERYVKTKPILWNPDPVLETLMGIKDERGAVLGPKRAAELLKQWDNVWEIIHQRPETISMLCPGISMAMAKRLVEALKIKSVGVRDG